MSTRLGNAVLSRVVETSFAPGFTMFGGTPEHAWAENADLLAPSFVDLEARTWRVAIQTWVLDVDGLRILIDTGVGNGKRRPAIPVLDGLDTGFLAALESAGVSPESVDIVVNTHLHSDHVGWNTRADGAEWAPTFPNARYLMPETDFRHFGPDGAGCDDAARIVFDDSVAPVYEAGQVELFGGDHQLSESVWLRPAAGHTPGSSVLWLDAGAPAVFVGDLTHCAIQIPRPGDACAFDCDAAQAVATRTRVFTEAVRRRATVIPAHYPGHGGATLVARGDAFLVDDWLDIEPI
ncbi:MAG: MBL fold metallo-hydrolase [Mycolicibacterium neoaurum]|uniref:MBL fold metallo-hydrolase n=1 Tax=Mycolicibacterium neoaurum TaxID=1795 RepID=UPI002FF61732